MISPNRFLLTLLLFLLATTTTVHANLVVQEIETYDADLESAFTAVTVARDMDEESILESNAKFLLEGASLDITGYLSLPCIRDSPRRLETSAKLVQAALVGQVSLQLDTMTDFLEDIVEDPEEFYHDLVGVRTFRGLNEVAEENTLAQLTNNFYTFLQREITTIECLEDKPDTLVVVFREIAMYNYFQDTLQRQSYQLHRFATNNSSRLESYESRFSPVLTEAVTENLSGVVTAKDMCNEAALECPGDLFPFETLQECYLALGSVPSTCAVAPENPCYDCLEKNTAFLGDTLQCRHYHMLQMKLRPEAHCPLLANITESCQPKQCPNAPARLSYEETIEKNDLEPYDASLSNWLRTIEGICCLFFLILPFVTFTLYKLDKRAHFNVQNLHRNMAEISAAQPSSSIRTKNNTQLPVMNIAFRLLRKHWPHDPNDPLAHVVVHTDEIDIGGCKLTAVNGPSGCGKSTLMKLLCGFPQPHMELEVISKGQNIREVPVAYTPQGSDLWPRCMRVRDILGFACLLQGCDMNDYLDCVAVLQLQLLLDQAFNTLSGGQQQRVHFLANMIRKEPSVLFMDEPLSALDEENAVAALELLKQLPVAHSFVITVHRISPVLRKHFDRILEIDLENKKMLKYHISADSQEASRQNGISSKQETTTSEATVRASGNSKETPTGDKDKEGKQQPQSIARKKAQPFGQCVQAMFYLWHALFWGWPALDAGLVVIGALTAFLLGSMGVGALSIEDTVGFIPSSTSARMPVYMLNFIANGAALSAFVVALILSREDRMVLEHFVIQGDMGSMAVVVFNFLRFGFYGIMLALILTLIPLGLMGEIDEGWDTIIANVAFFNASYQFLCYSLSLSVEIVYGTHLLLLTFLPMTMFTGLFFPWSTLTPFFKLLHYINPLWYCITACSHLLLATFEPNCPPHSYPYLVCAESAQIAEISEMQPYGSMASQIVSAIVTLLAVLLFLFLYRQRPSFVPLDPSCSVALHESVISPGGASAGTAGTGGAHASSVLSGGTGTSSGGRTGGRTSLIQKRRVSNLTASASTWLEARRTSINEGLSSSFTPLLSGTNMGGIVEGKSQEELSDGEDDGGKGEGKQREQALADEVSRLKMELAAYRPVPTAEEPVGAAPEQNGHTANDAARASALSV